MIGVGVGVLGFGAFGLLALAEPPMTLNRSTSISAAVKITKRRFCLCMGIFLSITFLEVIAYVKNNSVIFVILFTCRITALHWMAAPSLLFV
jgi:hypothetical protein